MNRSTYLSGEEQEIGILIVERNDDTSGVIEGLSEDRSGHVLGVPDHELTRSTTAETYGDDLIVLSEPQGATTLDTDVRVSLLGNGLLARVDDADLLVLSIGAKERTIVVPVERLDNVGVSGGGELGGSALDIPDPNFVVLAGSRDKVLDYGMELNDTYLAFVSLQSLNVLQKSVHKFSIQNAIIPFEVGYRWPSHHLEFSIA